MTIKLTFLAKVKDYDDLKGLREQIGMCFEELGDVRLISVSTVKGSEPPKVERGTYGHVMLSDAGYGELVRRLGKGAAEARINELSYKLHQKGYRFKDHFAVILEWDEEERERGAGGRQAASFDVDEFFNAAVKRTAGGDCDSRPQDRIWKGYRCGK